MSNETIIVELSNMILELIEIRRNERCMSDKKELAAPTTNEYIDRLSEIEDKACSYLYFYGKQ